MEDALAWRQGRVFVVTSLAAIETYEVILHAALILLFIFGTSFLGRHRIVRLIFACHDIRGHSFLKPFLRSIHSVDLQGLQLSFKTHWHGQRRVDMY